jgi:hypothetical protein
MGGGKRIIDQVNDELLDSDILNASNGIGSNRIGEKEDGDISENIRMM